MKTVPSKLKTYLTPRMTALPKGCHLHDPAILLATWFGVGLLRPAPGTLGTLASLPVGWLIYWLFGLYGFLAAIIIVFITGVYASDKFDRRGGTHDNSSIVIDETVGLWIAAIPAVTNLWLWGAAFILFRLFDIWKPWPISRVEEIEGGLGVMCDDALAGVFAFFGTAMLALPYMGVLYA